MVKGLQEKLGLAAASEDCGDRAGVTASMHHRDDPQGLFVRRVGDQIFMHQDEAQGPRS